MVKDYLAAQVKQLDSIGWALLEAAGDTASFMAITLPTVAPIP